MTETIVIDRRFNGPTNSGNGGCVCDLLAGAIEGSVEVTLHKPLPLAWPFLLSPVSSVPKAKPPGSN